MLNSIAISGRLTQVPTLQVKNNGESELKFLRFTIACQRNFKNSDGTYSADFIDCVAWRGTAQFIQAHFAKGQEIIIKGELRTDMYTDKEGKSRKSTYINVESAYFAGAKKTNEAAPISAPDEIPIPDDEYAPPLEAYLDPESEL